MDIKVNCGGMFTVLLTVAFIVLKLMGYITWSWVWVLAPIWIPLVFFLVMFLVVMIILTAKEQWCT